MKLLKMSDLVDITGLGKSTIYREISEGRFPKPIKIAERTSVWTERDITNWLNSKIQNHNSKEGNNRSYFFTLEGYPSKNDIFDFINEITDRLTKTAEDEMKAMRQRLLLERTKIIEETLEFLYQDDNRGERETQMSPVACSSHLSARSSTSRPGESRSSSRRRHVASSTESTDDRG